MRWEPWVDVDPCFPCWEGQWRGKNPSFVIGVALEFEGYPVLLASTTTDPERYTDALDGGWCYRGFEAYRTRGRDESWFIVQRLHWLREREGVSSLLDHGIKVPGSSRAFFLDEATSELLGTWMLTFQPDRQMRPWEVE